MQNTKNITKIIEISKEQFDIYLTKIITEHGFTKSENNPDIIIIEQGAKESIGIQEVKDLRTWAYIRPFNHSAKLILIRQADLLTIEAQNSILKITEEPPVFTFIYLFVENTQNLLPTIISRSEVISHKDNKAQTTSEVSNFLKLTLPERFKYIDNLHKEKAKKLILFLDQFLIYFRGNKDLLPQILELRKALTNNVNKKLILDNLVLALQEIK
jgi:hypothetical protein